MTFRNNLYKLKLTEEAFQESISERETISPLRQIRNNEWGQIFKIASFIEENAKMCGDEMLAVACFRLTSSVWREMWQY
jgi:hypothetical protein